MHGSAVRQFRRLHAGRGKHGGFCKRFKHYREDNFRSGKAHRRNHRRNIRQHQKRYSGGNRNEPGRNATTTNDVIDKLEKYDIVASFFLIGNNINDESAKAVKRAYDLGCEINNHSRTHSNMTELSAEDIRAEFEYTDEKVYEITGEHTKFFRPPYISVHQIVFDNIDVPFIAGIGANDWEDRVTAEMRAKMILKQAKDGDIILLHDAEGNSMTVEALDTIIPELQKQGYKFVTVTELFKIKGIEPDMEKVYTNVLQKNMYN